MLDIDDMTYDHDVMIDRGKVRKRRKAASKQFCNFYWHTPLSASEDIPCRCRRLVIGNGAAGRLPVVEQVRAEARRRSARVWRGTLNGCRYFSDRKWDR